MYDTNSTYHNPLDTSTNLHTMLTSLSSINAMETFAEVFIEQRAGNGYTVLSILEMQEAALMIWPWIPRAIKYLVAFPEKIPTMSDRKLQAMFDPKGELCSDMATRIGITALRVIEENRIVTHITRA